MKERDKAKQMAEVKPEMWPTHRQLCNSVTREIHIAIQDYYSGLS